MGNLYVDVHGDIEVTNMTKNIKVQVNISRQGIFTSQNALHRLEGKVMDETGKARYEISGKWSQYLNLKDLATGQEQEVFRAFERPPDSVRMYGFGFH